MTETSTRAPLVLASGQGRFYDMGRIKATFKADCGETTNRYSISEWWLEPNTKGPGAHSHDEDDVFYVLGGVMSFLVDDTWHDVANGGFVLVPGGVTHDFVNRGYVCAGVLNFSVPGGFEVHMRSIVEWFKQHPVGDANQKTSRRQGNASPLASPDM